MSDELSDRLVDMESSMRDGSAETLVSSLYVTDGNEWKPAFPQQTPM